MILMLIMAIGCLTVFLVIAGVSISSKLDELRTRYEMAEIKSGNLWDWLTTLETRIEKLEKRRKHGRR